MGLLQPVEGWRASRPLSARQAVAASRILVWPFHPRLVHQDIISSATIVLLLKSSDKDIVTIAHEDLQICPGILATHWKRRNQLARGDANNLR